MGRTNSFTFLALAMCAACSEQPASPTGPTYAEAWKLDIAETKITALEQAVARLEPSMPPPFKLSDGGFSFIETATGGGAMQWVGSEDNGNGASLKIRLGNPSTATWNQYSIIGTYGKLGEDGEPTSDPAKVLSVDLDQPIPAGSWRTVSVQLDGARAQDVGYLRVRGLIISNIGLNVE